MREPYQVIIKPVITEKSTRQIEDGNVYTFLVARDANKHEIEHAVEKLWDVQVQDVRTVNYRGKRRRSLMGRMAASRAMGRRPAFKKAFVKLAEGDQIEFYEAG
jgi:large subunit ribosomal protein L23